MDAVGILSLCAFVWSIVNNYTPGPIAKAPAVMCSIDTNSTPAA